jgi:ADP-heptose:LPS heptosyltransferase
MVGSDTGLMHIAAAVGCPTVTVFGKLNASKWGHAYPPHHVISSPGDDPRNLDPQVVVNACRQALSAS